MRPRTPLSTAAVRLHFGCGPAPAPGWLNLDRRALPGVELVHDLEHGLPLASGSVACAVGIHVLQDLPYPALVPVLAELRRVLQRDGVLRLGLPDLDRAIAAYERGDRSWFHVPDADARAAGAKLVVQAIWYGSVRTPFTFDFAAEQLARAGFRDVVRCAFHETRSARPDVAALDNRERESLFVEARA
jgi:hypothetical protein